MTLYDKIMTYDVETLAAFIYGLCQGTEERIQESLHNQGLDTIVVSVSEEQQIADNVDMLLQEVDDDT
jgi:hypothetical protein